MCVCLPAFLKGKNDGGSSNCVEASGHAPPGGMPAMDATEGGINDIEKEREKSKGKRCNKPNT